MPRYEVKYRADLSYYPGMTPFHESGGTWEGSKEVEARLMRLRSFEDLRRWLVDCFDDEAEWREIPDTITLCPGVDVKIRC